MYQGWDISLFFKLINCFSLEKNSDGLSTPTPVTSFYLKSLLVRGVSFVPPRVFRKVENGLTPWSH